MAAIYGFNYPGERTYNYLGNNLDLYAIYKSKLERSYNNLLAKYGITVAERDAFYLDNFKNVAANKKYLHIVRNKRTMKKIIIIGFLMFLFHEAFPQNKKKLYFLADTLQANASNPNKILEIKWTTPFHYSFIFQTEFKAPYYKYIEFSCRIDKKKEIGEVKLKKPRCRYISLKEFLALVRENTRYFNDIYDLYITEVLAGNKYRTFKVEIMPQYAPTQDSMVLKEKQ